MIIECAAKGAATGPGDCDLNGMQSVTSDASGQVTVDLTVTKGPFGADNIVCGPAQACLISVTQATPSPVQEADTPITLGLPGHARRDDDQPGHDRDLCRAARRTGTRMRVAPATLRNAVLLAHGESVIADASFITARQRAAATATAAEASADLVQLRCTAPGELAAQRMSARPSRVSDADEAIAARMEAFAEPWPDAAVIDTEACGTAGVAGESVDRALEAIRPHGPEHIWRPDRPYMLPG